MMKFFVKTTIAFVLQSLVNSYTLEDFKTKLFWKRPSEGKSHPFINFRLL